MKDKKRKMTLTAIGKKVPTKHEKEEVKNTSRGTCLKTNGGGQGRTSPTFKKRNKER